MWNRDDDMESVVEVRDEWPLPDSEEEWLEAWRDSTFATYGEMLLSRPRYELFSIEQLEKAGWLLPRREAA